MNNLLNIFKALSDKNRLLIVFALMEYNELCACQIIEFLNVSGATASRHLGILVNANIIQSRKDSRWVRYKLNEEKVSPFKDWLEKELMSSEEIKEAAANLVRIVSTDPQVICKKQRLA